MKTTTKSKRKKDKARVGVEIEGSSLVKENVSTAANVKIKAIVENPDEKMAPIVGYFPSGYDPLTSAIDSDSEMETNSSVKIYQSLSSPNPKKPRMQLVVGVHGSDVNFVGTNYSGEATTPQLCNYALGVFDKETGVLKIVPVTSNRIFRLEPKIGSLKEPETEVPEEEVTAMERADKFRNLTVMYSTKKNMRRDMKFQTLRQKEQDPESQQELDKMLNEIKINKDDFEANASTINTRNVPPHDLAATAPEMAYPLHKIIFEGEWNYLADIFEIAQTGSEVKPNVYPSFICNRVHKLKEVEDELEKKRRAGIFSYITHLVKFKDKHSMDGVSSAKHHKLPSILLQKFSSMFSLNDSRRIPDEKQQLLISYILVLSLFADNFQSDPTDIAKDLRMNPIALRRHYEYLGCKFVRDDNRVLVATLPLPLEFKKLRRKYRPK